MPNTSEPPINDNASCDDALQALEEQIARMVEVVSQLRQENESLRHQQSGVLEEKNALLDQNQKARERIEALISTLKSME